ncbi:formate dehydrogenase accessory sulfurtransferase FdhD [Sulfurospirillum sp. 1612]|uniref:formate dehydrogenase accessory sulfurtransferase FdhD n=1 Tax=Sulfurospirillum sp. 1612 TaxID=3094835 RepID=UPI002F95751D
MGPIFTTQVTKIKNNKKFETDDTVIREIKLDININGKRIVSLMATPTDLKELSIGYLISENIIEKVSDITQFEITDIDTKIYKADIKATINEASSDKLNTEGVIVSGCGRGASTHISLKSIEAKVMQDDFYIDANLLFKEMGEFYTQCPLYEQTGCVHTAKIHIDDSIYFIGEDIAQHNTIDKAVGKALLAGHSVNRAFLMVSGRLSSEMVAKAVMHQIPILASRTASTCRGVNIAAKFGLTLIGFVRGQSMNIYRNPERIHVES